MIRAPELQTDEPLRGEVSFARVTTRALRSGRSTLRDQTFVIPPKGLTVLESASRSSPQAVMKLLLGQLVPDAGRVRLDGQDPRERLHKRGEGGIVYVGYAPVVLNASIIENIAGVIETERVRRAYEAAEQLGITEFVITLPMGFETHMRESGMHESSTGFLQLVNIARAMAQNPSVLLLADCCSAADEVMRHRTREAVLRASRDRKVIATDAGGLFDKVASQIITLKTARSYASSTTLREKPPKPESESLRATV